MMMHICVLSVHVHAISHGWFLVMIIAYIWNDEFRVFYLALCDFHGNINAVVDFVPPSDYCGLS